LFLLFAIAFSFPSSTIYVESTSNDKYTFNSSVGDDGQTLFIMRGHSYDFVIPGPSACGFQIVTSTLWGSLYNWKRAKDPEIAPGLKNAGCLEPCVVHYDVPLDAPSFLFWQCASQPKLFGKIKTYHAPNQFSEGDNVTASAPPPSPRTYMGAIIVGCGLIILLIICVVMAIYFNRQNQRTSFHEKSRSNTVTAEEDTLNERIENESTRLPLSPAHQIRTREY